MKITVAICTWNRANLLDITLKEMAGLIIPEGMRWELLVVNNNCTDDTDAVIARHAAKLPLRRLFEPKQGHSNSRNCAVAAAQGDIIVWTDDDVLVEPEWLAEYVKAARAWPAAAFFGGPVRPWFPEEPPAWLKAVWPRVANAFAIRELGPDVVPLDHTRLPFGANYAVHLEVQRRHLYNPSLGRNGKGMRGADETTVLLAMLADGLTGIWVPTACVKHYIPPERQTRRYLRTFYHGLGEVKAGGHADDCSARLFGKPRWMWRRALIAELRYRLRRLYASPRLWVEDLIDASQWWGRLRGFSASFEGGAGAEAGLLPAVPRHTK